MKNEKIIIRVEQNGKLYRYKAKKMVSKTGSAGHVLLPRELVGKIVEINYNSGEKIE